MSILIIGKSKINELIWDRFNREGLGPIFIKNLSDIKKVEGEVGNFNITLTETDKNILATHIVITEEPVFAPFTQQLKKNINANSSYGSNIVFIMDYPEESQAYNTFIVLNKAIEFAKKKRKVVCLLKFIRTAGSSEGSLERLYRDARNLGVTFIKYSNISVNYNMEQCIFKIDVTHKIGKTSIETDLLILAGYLVPGEDLDKISKLLRLKLNKDGFANGSDSFLYPTLTSRKGIFLVNAKLLPGGDRELADCINFTISKIKEDIKNFSVGKKDSESLFFAQVDSEKCAFCYTCYRVCPHHAMSPDYENSIMQCMKNACYGCGICVSICPAGAVNIASAKTNLYYNIKCDIECNMGRDFGSDVENYESKTLKIICCENSGEIAVKKLVRDLADIYEGIFEEQQNNRIEVVPVSCGGEISTEMILDSLRSFEKVLVITCVDEACKHFEGNKRAKLYVERAKKFLKDSGLDDKRIEYIQVSHAMPYVVSEHIRLLIDKTGDGKR